MTLQNKTTRYKEEKNKTCTLDSCSYSPFSLRLCESFPIRKQMVKAISSEKIKLHMWTNN